tara:strand:+ start:623 stop:913 length:291 start_codon:yes stop_codon:yes gene_type:complete
VRRLIFRSSASAALLEISRFTRANWGAGQARKYGARLREQIQSLREFPFRFPEVEYRPGVRQMRCGQHLIFYRASNDAIEIIQILHVARHVEGWPD